MGKITRSQASSERENWDKIFNSLVKMLKSQQEQLETLVKERKIFEDRIRMQHKRWVSEFCLYEDCISQMKSDIVARDMTHLLEAAKSDMMLGLKHREASLLKLKLEHTDDELADFRAWFDLLKENLKDNESKSVGGKILEGEVGSLKHEYSKVASEKRSEISTLLAQKDFARHQFKLMESDLTSKLNSKRAEVDQANEKIVELLASVEQLQSSNNDKDEFIAKLKTKITEMEAGTNKWNEEISKLTQELELLRKSRTARVTPVLNCRTSGARTSNVGSRNRNRTMGSKNGSNVFMEKELPITQVPDILATEKASRSSKRKLVDVPSSYTPHLFSSKFTVPKLKNPSPPFRKTFLNNISTIN